MNLLRHAASTALRPLGPRGVALMLALLIPAWMLYCLAYASLDSRRAVVIAALGSALSVVVPWAAAFEVGKRLFAPTAASRATAKAALLLVATLGASLVMERVAEALLPAMQPSPLSLMILRRLPAWALLAGLWAMAERQRAVAPMAGELPIAAAVIDWVSAADNYVEIHVGARTITHRMTMRHVEHLLPGAEFARVHRSILVRLDRIRAVRRDRIELIDGSELPVGSRYRRNLPTFDNRTPRG